MASIPAAICKIYGNNFKRHYLRNKRLFVDFLLILKELLNLLKCAWNLEHFRKKDEYLSLIISEIIDAKLLMLKDVAV